LTLERLSIGPQASPGLIYSSTVFIRWLRRQNRILPLTTSLPTPKEVSSRADDYVNNTNCKEVNETLCDTRGDGGEQNLN
jgi:hypothetical protein